MIETGSQARITSGGGGGGGMAIGGAIGGGAVPTDVLFVGGTLAAPVLAQDFGLKFVTKTFYAPHLGSDSPNPTITIGPGFGGGSLAFSVTGNDQAGRISLKIGTAPAAGSRLCTITFASTYSALPSAVIIQGSNINSVRLVPTLQFPFVPTVTTNTFELWNQPAQVLVTGVIYNFFYMVMV